MKKLKASELIVGKLYWVIPNSRSILRLRSIGKYILSFSHHSGDDVYSRGTDGVILFGHDHYFCEVIEPMGKSEIIALIDITIDKAKQTIIDLQEIKKHI